jgi:hypothetical protein
MRSDTRLRDVLAGRLVLAALALATLGALPAPHATPAPLSDLPPSLVLSRYEAALASLLRPKALSFEYTVEQLGPHNLEQTHRVYRSGVRERDETLVVDGYALKQPAVRIFTNRSYRYDVASIAPTSDAYSFAYAGLVRAPDGYAYTFRTEAREATPFAVTAVDVDGRTFLPAVVHFKIAGNGARGSGVLQYAGFGPFWLVREAQVNVHVDNGALGHERIVWSDYQFHASLPPSTFEEPPGTSPGGGGL